MSTIRNIIGIYTAPLALRLSASQAGAGMVEGYAALFGLQASKQSKLAPSAFTRALAERRASGNPPLMLFNGDPADVIGSWTGWQEDARGLKISGRLNLNSRRGRQVHALLMRNAVDGLSTTFKATAEKAGADGVIEYLEVDPWQVSIMDKPQTGEAVQASSKADLEDILRSGGLSKIAARKVAAGGWQALQKTEKPDDINPGDLSSVANLINQELFGLQTRRR